MRIIITLTILLWISNHSLTISADQRLAILPFKNHSEQKYNWISIAVSDSLTSQFSEIKKLTLVEREHIKTIQSSHSKKEVLQLTGANYLLLGSYIITKNNILLTARVIHNQSSQILNETVITEKGELTDLIKIQNDLAYEIAQKMQISISKSHFKLNEAKNYNSFREFSLGKIKLANKQFEDALQHFLNAQEFNQSFFPEAHHLEGQSRICIAKNTKSKTDREKIVEEHIKKFREDAGKASFAFYDLGIAYQASEQHQRAIEAYQKYLKWVLAKDKMIRWEIGIQNTKQKLNNKKTSPTPFGATPPPKRGQFIRDYTPKFEQDTEKSFLYALGKKVFKTDTKTGKTIWEKTYPNHINSMIKFKDKIFIECYPHYHLISLSDGENHIYSESYQKTI